MVLLSQEEFQDKFGKLIQNELSETEFDVFNQTNKLPKSKVLKVFSDIPDNLAQMGLQVVEDSEFNELIKQLQQQKAAPQPPPQMTKPTPKNTQDEMPTFSEEEEQKESPSLRQHAKIVSQKTGIPEDIAYEVLSKAIKGDDKLDKLTELIATSSKLPADAEISKKIADQVIGQELVQTVAGRDNKPLNLNEILNSLIVTEIIKSLRGGEAQKSDSNTEIFKYLLETQQKQMELILTLLTKDNKNNDAQTLAIIKEMSDKYNQTYQELFRQLKESNEKQIQAILDALKKLETPSNKSDIEKIAEAYAKSAGSNINLSDIAKQLKDRLADAKEFFEALGYKVEKSDSGQSLDKILNSKFGDAIINLLTNPEKIGSLLKSIKGSPVASVEQEVSEMPKL